jgi:hypothetical protein
LWRVKTSEVEYICRLLPAKMLSVTPEIEGLSEFKGEVVHACYYSASVFHSQIFYGKNLTKLLCFLIHRFMYYQEKYLEYQLLSY